MNNQKDGKSICKRKLFFLHSLLSRQTGKKPMLCKVLVKHGDEFYAFGQPTVFPDLPELGSLGMVYCRTNVPEDQLEGYRYTMAIDK